MIYIDNINLLHKYKCDIFEKVIYNNHYIDVNLPVSINK